MDYSEAVGSQEGGTHCWGVGVCGTRLDTTQAGVGLKKEEEIQDNHSLDSPQRIYPGKVQGVAVINLFLQSNSSLCCVWSPPLPPSWELTFSLQSITTPPPSQTNLSPSLIFSASSLLKVTESAGILYPQNNRISLSYYYRQSSTYGNGAQNFCCYTSC